MPGTGRFWAVGVGPGDPELLTLKATRLIGRAHVVCHAGPAEREGRAWGVIRNLLRPEQEVRGILTEAMKDVTPDAYRPGVEQIAADCRSGLDVAFVTEGDPTVYSTATVVWQLLARIAPEVPIEVVPGVSSITAAAARLGWPLAQKDEPFAVVPAGYHRDYLASFLHAFPTVCLLKVQQALPQLAKALKEFGPTREAVHVEDVSTEAEHISHDLASVAGRKGYFALVLVRRTSQNSAPLAGKPAGPGKLWLVGLGPGDPRLLTPQALDALRGAEMIVGYEGYLQALIPLALTGELHGSPIGAEAERAAWALKLATGGRRVALVSSGDAGVYGMASLLLETAAKVPELDLEVIPGVTAATAAAALLGAPLGHDFACISLSDLLTPWDVIERRLEAVGRGDLVLALYNPASRRRTWQLPRARDILLSHRPPHTPVGLVERAYRPGMCIRHTTLADLSADGVTMETTVIIGSSRTRIVNGRMVTPRGYGGQA
jgi:precorrin-2 C20-methyltransferase/precorrin-3B C17-methyltransferase